MQDPEKNGRFEAVYNRHKAGIYNFCRRMLGDGDEAKDVVQEVFMRYFESPAEFDGDLSVKVWLFKSARNQCLNVIRDKSKFWDPGKGSDQFPATGRDDARDIEAPDIVGRLLDKMSSDYKEIPILREWDQLSYDEIARTLETTVGAVKSKLFKARKQAAVIYKKLYGD